MEEKLILNITKLRYFKKDNKKYGDFYVTTTNGDYFTYLNADEIKILPHFLGEKVENCIVKPTKRFKEEFFKIIGD